MTTVTDADREAAEYYGTAIGYPEKDPSGDILRTAFARHREAEVPKEVAKIVAMLDQWKAQALQNESPVAAYWFAYVKKAIIAGEYRDDA